MNQALVGRFKGPKIKWTEEEMETVFAFYFFIYRDNSNKFIIERFLKDLRRMTLNDRSFGSINMRIANFISVDPEKRASGFDGAKEKCSSLWRKNVDSEGKPQECFIQLFADFIDRYAEDRSVYAAFLSNWGRTQNHRFDSGGNVFCEVDRSHTTFENKEGNNFYVRQFLIPLESQEQFSVDLAIKENVVELCPLCSLKLKYAKDQYAELKTLYDKKIRELNKKGIFISFEELIKLYKKLYL